MRRLAALALAAALGVAGCAGAEDDPDATASPRGDISLITVGQSETNAPSLEYERGLTYVRAQTTLMWDGDGAPLQPGQPLLLDLYGESLDDGTPIENTYDGLPKSFILAPEIIGQDLYDTLVRAHVGARVLTVAPPESTDAEEPPVAMVIDVLSDRAVGDPLGQAEDMPQVTETDRGEPRLEVGDDVSLTGDLHVATLIRGDGSQVRADSRLTVNFTAFYLEDGEDEDGPWEAGDIFETSWPVEQAPLVVDMAGPSTLPGLQQGLLDQTSRSRVLIIVPTTLGYPERGTMAFVIDILDVWNPEG